MLQIRQRAGSACNSAGTADLRRLLLFSLSVMWQMTANGSRALIRAKDQEWPPYARAGKFGSR
jgi:hypothetical protein